MTKRKPFRDPSSKGVTADLKSCGCEKLTSGCPHAAGDEIQADVSRQQRRLLPESSLLPRARLRRNARWWELEARRGYPSSDSSLEYARNLRWLVELLDNGVNIRQPFHVLLKVCPAASPLP